MKNILSVVLFFVAFLSFGQKSESVDSLNQEVKINVASAVDHSVDMADILRSEGKIYVVVLVILILLSGLLVYLVMADKRLKRLEEEFETSHK